MSEPQSDRVSVLIVDDHELVRQGIRAFLDAQDDLEVVGEAGNGREALALVESLVPDVILMDLLMPGMDGIETTRRVKEISPRSQVVVLTSHHDDGHVFPALRAGPTATQLTRRELEVLKLVAEGLANLAIAERLGIAEKTVKGHVGNVLSKLHLADRTQAAVFAWRTGVVSREDETGG